MGKVYSKKETIIKEKNLSIKNRSTNSWLDAVVKKKGFDVIEIVDIGIVRASLIIKLPQSSNKIAVYVWRDEYIKNFLSPWKNFQNKHISPLLYSEAIKELNAVVIYTISECSTLQEEADSKEIRKDKRALSKILVWLTEATEALAYIHNKGYAVMNINSSNISMFEDDGIKLDKLHFLNPINTSYTR